MIRQQHPERRVNWPWWTIDGEALMAMLRRCHAGEAPDMVYLEAYADSDHEHFGPDGEAAS